MPQTTEVSAPDDAKSLKMFPGSKDDLRYEFIIFESRWQVVVLSIKIAKGLLVSTLWLVSVKFHGYDQVSLLFEIFVLFQFRRNL